MQNQSKRLRFGLRSAVHIFAMTGTAIADQSYTSLAAVRADGSDTLDEIVVTAEKRSMNMLTTPLAMTALSGDALLARHVTDLEGLTSISPSFTYAQQGPTAAVNIRGIGLALSSPNVASGVPVYRDGVLGPALLPNERFVDIADVEVLRGPQGTLIGANSTGGAVFINTRNPELGRTDGYAQFEGGSYDRLSVQSAYNMPLSDTVAVRGAVSWMRQDAFWTDLLAASTDHAPPGAINQIGARIGALYEPNGTFSAALKINFQDDQNGGMAHTPYAGTNAAIGYPTRHYALSYPDPNTEFSDYQVRISLLLKYKFDDGITFRSISGFFDTYEYYNDEQYVDPTTTTVVSAPFINRIVDHVYTQEFNFLSPTEARLHWVAGTFSQHWLAHDNANPNTPTIVADVGTVKDSNAVYGELGYDLTPTIEVHSGLRETFNHAYGNGGVFLIPANNLEIQSNRVGQTDNELTGRVGVNWKVTPDQFVYAFAAKGAKTGGINAQGEPNFEPETVYDYEAGLKSSWFADHLNTQVGIFNMHYKNMQLAVRTPAPAQAPVQTITNVGNSTIDGAEVSIQSRFRGWHIDGNLAFVHSSVSAPPLLNTYLYQIQGYSPKGVQCEPGQTTNCFNYAPYYQSASGVSNPYSPRWTGNIGLSYIFNIHNGATLAPRADFSYSSTQWATIFENPVDRFQLRDVLNLSLTYARDGLKIAAYGTNVTHAYFIVGQTGSQNFWNAPVEYGIRISQAF
jgi:iron complex outermembrane receptor protein